MPFGLCGAPGTFMRVMDQIFGDQNFQTMLIYLDDICIFGATFEQALEWLELVLSCLAEHHLKVKPEKCFLFMEKLCYLGHIVTKKGVQPDPEKTWAVEEWPVPKTEMELRVFLGLAGYYWPFVPGFAQIAAPLFHS